MAEKKSNPVQINPATGRSWLALHNDEGISGGSRRSGDYCRFSVERESRFIRAAEKYQPWRRPGAGSQPARHNFLTNLSGLYLRIFSGEDSGFPAVQIAAAIEFFRNIGGDFYTIYNLPGRRVGVVIADVCGKDRHAAAYVPVIQEALHREINTGLYAGQILSNINNTLSGILPDDRFATLFLGIYDTISHSLEFANAGHPAAVLMHTDGANSELGSTGPGLGMMQDMQFGTCNISVSPNELLVLYTDGYDREMEIGRSTGSQNNFLNVIEKNRSRPAKDIVRTVQEHMQNRMRQPSRSDDRTMMVLQFTGAGRGV
jgi:sigma-B regulation protein RsbU (phosphoserine phosphatase)